MLYLFRYPPSTRRGNREVEHRLGRILLQYGLQKEYGRHYPLEEETQGKPFIKDAPQIGFNISHTTGLVACAISNCQIGVDVEHIRPFHERLLKRVCSVEEQAYVLASKAQREERFFRLWTLKESYVKAIGKGLAFPLRNISFTIEQDGMIRGSLPGWQYTQARVYGHYILSVCKADTILEENHMSFDEMFQKVKALFQKADVSKVEEHLAFQFNIRGDGEGAFYAEVKDGALTIEPYEYYDRDAAFTCTAETLFKMAQGKLDPVLAFTTGRLKVEGSIDQALKLQKLL